MGGRGRRRGTVPSGRQKKSENLVLDNWSLSCLKNVLGSKFDFVVESYVHAGVLGAGASRGVSWSGGRGRVCCGGGEGVYLG